MQAQCIGKTSRGITATIRYASEEEDDGKLSVGSEHAANSTFDALSPNFVFLVTRQAARRQGSTHRDR